MLRLPLELKREIYAYTLIANNPVALTEDFEDWFQETLQYTPLERRNRADQELERALRFFIRSSRAPDKGFAHAYFLSHNTFYIHSKRGAYFLADQASYLSTEGHFTFVYGIKAEIPHDPMTMDPDLEDDNMIENPGAPVDPDDYEEGDGNHPGLRAFRVLRPLLELPSLRNLHIVLREGYDCEVIFRGVGQGNAGIHIVAAVIAKLKAMVLAASTTPNFKVDLQVINGDDIYEEDDISWLWYLMSRAERRRAEEVLEHRRKTEDLSTQASIARRNIEWNMGEFPRAQLQADKERLEVELADIRSRFTSQENDGQLLEQLVVTQLAGDPEWEKAAEALAVYQPEDDEM